MAVTTQRRLHTPETRRFGSDRIGYEIPDLTEIQTASYAKFMQYDGTNGTKRKDEGLESVLREIFPIESYDKSVSLDYLRYELGKPRYEPDECRQLRLTYGRPLRIWLRLNREEPIEEEVYLGDLPIMMGGGEFIINGAERVVVSQLHRSPGIDFVSEIEAGDRKVYSCRVIPERGSWIEFNTTKKDSITVRIDQSGKFSVVTLMRAMGPEFSLDSDILRAFYDVKKQKIVDGRSATKIEGKIAVDDIVYPVGSDRAGEIILEGGQRISANTAEVICTSGIKIIEVMDPPPSPHLLNALADDATSSHEEALLRIYQRLRPGNPPQLEKARTLFAEKFFDTNRYRLGRVGRFRINRKLDLDVPESEMILRSEDVINSVNYLLGLAANDSEMYVDDIDHLGNRRLRTIDELACDELRKGFLKLRRTVQERMNVKDVEDMTPRGLINPKSISAAIEYFFGRGELSQVVDQTNPLSMLTHERRLSALGPGGLNRKRAGFEVRDVHVSHYGRICPIETPEGTNIGLISSLAMYASVDDYGFLVTPYQRVKYRKLVEGDDSVVWLRADQEHEAYVASADSPMKDGVIQGDTIVARYRADFSLVPTDKIEFIDVAPSQMIGVSAGLIPFLEHDDANRALMGSNMQRQAVPLLVAEPPIVGTGLEQEVARHSGLLVRAGHKGTVTYADAERIEIGPEVHHLRKYRGLNERTCQNQKPIVKPGDKVEKGQVIADGAATWQGDLALGRNVLVAFMSFEGYNYEDAIILSEELVHKDTYTSIHIEEFDVEIRETKLGREEFTRDIPNVSEKMLRNLDEGGVVQIGTYVKPGDILCGKVSPKSKTELTPEEKLLHAIFGRAGEDVKNDSLEVPSGVEGIVIDTQKFSRRMSLSEEERKEFERSLKAAEEDGAEKITTAFTELVTAIEEVLKKKLTDDDGNSLVHEQDPKFVAEQATIFRLDRLDIRSPERQKDVEKIYKQLWPAVEEAIDARDRTLNSMKRGDELRSGVLQMVKVYIATKRLISVGDKMAGRHGNKGVISKIMPVEDMPFLPDGTPVQIMLNPLGVPSRMNVGQILETHLGWAGAHLGFRAITPVFNGATEEEINDCLEAAGLPRHGKARLNDGRTGEPLEQETTVGYIYMLKLHHLVDDKVHARSTGPYSLITQQPLGGKARFGGQRFGEMEVWALEAYGAAYILQELLTVKSDDVEGRTKIYESMVKGENTLEAGTPASFDVLTNEIRGLGLNMQLEKRGL